MTPTYSYDPTQITENGINKMRFELGDTVVDMGPASSPLCDEEYQAIIDQYGQKSWRKARFMCLSAIVMKLAYEVDTSVDGLSYSLSQRYDRWKAMKDKEEAALAAMCGVPIARADALMPAGGTPYFYNDMQANRRGYGRRRR